MVRKHKRFLLFLFAFSFVMRLLFFLVFLGHDKNYWTCDSQEYHEIAVQIAQGNGIVDSAGATWFGVCQGTMYF